MRLPRVRVAIWWGMVVVAIMGLGLGGLVMMGRREALLERAAYHADQAARYREEMRRSLVPPGGDYTVGGWAPTDQFGPRYELRPGDNHFTLVDPKAGPTYSRAREHARHHERVRAIYERAAQQPWFAVDPDPPEPE